MINEKTLMALEFNKIREKLSGFAVSQSGKVKCLGLEPCKNIDEAHSLLDETDEADRILYAHAISLDFSFDDITEIIVNADKNICLTMADLLKVARVLKISRNIFDAVNKINDNEIVLIKDYANMLFNDLILENDIYKCILGENEMADNASVELKRIRDAITKCNINIKNKLNMFISSASYNKYLQDSIVTIRNNRYVIPVKSEYKGQIQGLIHDQSASGATVFIEPFAIVQLNNEIAELKISENYEIERILKQFTIRVGSESESIKTNFTVLTEMDVIFAKALFAHNLKAEKPSINDNGLIEILKGRHPLIDRTRVVPVTVKIGKGKKILLITGPNTGGKTVTLKLVGLFSIMAMCGIFPPCDYGSNISFYENIFCDIGDEQSIENSLSTFSSHLTNLIYITENINGKSLVLLDELGAGTDPTEGACLAVAITEKLSEIGATAIITTHYQQMKEYALTHDDTISASMDFNPDTFEPTYKLLSGSAGSSNAIEIAARLGLNKEIIGRAKSLLSEDKVNFDAIVLSAEKSRREAEEDRQLISDMKLEILKELAAVKQEKNAIMLEREKLNQQMRKEAKKILEDYLEEADEAIENIKNIVSAPTEEGLFKARKIKSKLSNINYLDETNEKLMEFDNSAIKVGDKVYIKSLDKIAEVIADDTRKCEYTVKMGLITTNIKYTKVNKIVSDNKKKEQRKEIVTVSKPINTSGVPLELNIIGQRASEAMVSIEEYLDKAVLSGLHEVRIVHGKGNGVLRNVVSDCLGSHPAIESYRLGKYGEGEWGVTIAVLK